MTKQNPEDMTEAELAEWQYAHRDELDSEEGEPVEFEVGPQVSVTMSFRLSGTEADAIREAAHEAGVSLSEWIRGACADALHLNDDDSSAFSEVEAALLEAERQAEKQFAAMEEYLEAIRKKSRLAVRRALKDTTSKAGNAARGKPSRGKPSS